MLKEHILPQENLRQETQLDKKQIFVAWTSFIRRPESMKPFFGYQLFFMSPLFENRWLKPWSYLINIIRTFYKFLLHRPKVIWVQLAPPFLLYAAFSYKLVLNRHVEIIADCHNSMFRPFWFRLPLTRFLLNRCTAVLVHNKLMYRKALEMGIDEDRLICLETRPFDLDPADIEVSATTPNFPRPWVLFPCSFNADEPFEAVFEAAALAPELHFIVTGKTERAHGLHDLKAAPPNVKLVGFLPKQHFNRLLVEADLILGLTTYHDVQLSVANEAVGVGKPMVISDTPLLRKLFGKGAKYVETTNPVAIANGCRQALLEKDSLKQEIQELREERIQRWKKQAESVVETVNSLPLAS
jgi:glycosyltransferase involved in cell wall biosynthesis